MVNKDLIKPTPWDSYIFNIPTWELTEYSSLALKEAKKNFGHYTVKVNPLANKSLLHEYNFYYCDSLIEPFCIKEKFKSVSHPDARICKSENPEPLLTICDNAFEYGRFHRDFSLEKRLANLRYDKWLSQLAEKNQVFELLWQEDLAGFVAYNDNSLVLHAVAKKYKGKGISKYWWSEVCNSLFAKGHLEIVSSISSSNLAALNLYASLGFSFRNPQDVYQYLNNSN
jgi:hypothetical protein